MPKAKRNEVKPRYDLIPLVALKALADRYGLGAVNYGEDNWKHGDEEFFKQAFCHIIEHLYKYKNNDSEEDTPIQNLAAAAWGCFSLIWWENEKLRKSDSH